VAHRPETRPGINVPLLAFVDEFCYKQCMHFGYARVSTGEQTLDLQLDALTAADCGRIFRDTASGAKSDRPGLGQALDHLRDGDTLVVWRLDRLGRSLRHLIDTLTALDQCGIGFRSLTEAIDTTTPGGKLVFHIFGALAEFERDLIKERTNAGLAAARARGRLGGRRKAFADPAKLRMAKTLFADTKRSIPEICTMLGVSRSTLYRYVGSARPDAPAATEADP
jgi:DNA invertase Pin-like site-specific DNA recombinase